MRLSCPCCNAAAEQRDFKSSFLWIDSHRCPKCSSNLEPFYGPAHEVISYCIPLSFVAAGLSMQLVRYSLFWAHFAAGVALLVFAVLFAMGLIAERKIAHFQRAAPTQISLEALVFIMGYFGGITGILMLGNWWPIAICAMVQAVLGLFRYLKRNSIRK